MLTIYTPLFWAVPECSQLDMLSDGGLVPAVLCLFSGMLQPK